MGMLYLIILCIIITLFSSLTISLYEKKKCTKKKKDPYSFLFDVYDK
nr:hypothetical protein [Ectobacillus panaciterrae]